MPPQTAAKGTAPTYGHPSGDPEPVRVRLLGGFQVSVGARTIGGNEWRLRRASDVVKLLALAPDHRMHREQIMYLLWPESGREAAANNLRQALYGARQVLGPVPGAATSSHFLRLEGERLALCPDGQLWVDVEAFEAAAVTARHSSDPAAYRATINLYSGDLLPEDRYEDWAEDRRMELREKYLALLVEMANLCEAYGDLGSAIDALREVVSDEPAHEEAHTALMRLFAKSGQRFQALRQYERLREALRRKFGIEPGPSSRRLHEEIVAGRLPAAPSPSEDLPPRELPSARRHNLPTALSSFVGREREMVEVERVLAMTRLLTLTGVGGSGKTRLALEAAKDVLGTFQDGAWVTDLAPLSNPDLLPQVVAAALGVRERPGDPLTVTLQEALGDKELLLVLDNCEHLTDACAHLAETLLGSSPGLRILATSREALGLAGEGIWVVPPLALPDLGPLSTPEELAVIGSVRLFLDRARYRQPTFALNPHNVSVVADICRRLDGIPLAIEFAAARVGTMSVEDIAARLENSLGLLTRGNRTAPPRQRTMRGVLEWSHRLLSELEQTLFARLSVFAGGWTLEAAEAVGSGNRIKEGEMLDLLSGLVDKSLVGTEATQDDGVRYRMLEPVRQYARERLEASGDADELRSRHAAYFLAEAEVAEPELVGPQQRWWLDRLEREHDNLRAALGWSLECRDLMALRLGGALARFWYTRGYLSEGRRWLEEGLVAGSGTASASLQAKVLEEMGWLAEAQGDYEQASAAYEERLGIYRRLGDKKGIANALGNLGAVALPQGDHGRATQLLEESLVLLRELANERDIARVLTSLGILALSRNDHARAAALLEEALTLVRKAGDVRGMAIALNNLGFATLFRGDPERATTLLKESLEKYREVGDTHGMASSLLNLGLARLTRGDHGRAAVLLKESLAVVQDTEDKQTVAECLEAMAGVAGMQALAKRTAQLWGAAQKLREDIGAPLPSDERAILEPHVAIARAQLGEEAWEATSAKGRKLTLEQAVEYALSREESAPSVPSDPERRPSVDEPPVALTRREMEVAALVARELTNRQIASELVISERTVDHHVANILKKLGLHSRSEVAARMAE
jgi:predicted ATPase/DNA-binding SARP family transcriptional activator/DNA-binding CsgD family transcriptional regulator/Tfp pilus assembly protein PilF